jgi:hypothetical protein
VQPPVRDVVAAPGHGTSLAEGAIVHSLAVEWSEAQLARRASDSRIGLWAVASLATDTGGWRPIKRVGLPMIHPLFTQYDDALGDDLDGDAPRTTTPPMGNGWPPRSPRESGPTAPPRTPTTTGKCWPAACFPTSRPTPLAVRQSVQLKWRQRPLADRRRP